MGTLAPAYIPLSGGIEVIWSNLDKLLYLVITGILFSVLYWVITTPDDPDDEGGE